MSTSFRRVFVLTTGRAGSTTLARACGHIDNWTAGHETRNTRLQGRLSYPSGHIEVDNRLAWHLGGLAARYGDDETLWVHLRRDPVAVAESYTHRFYVRAGIMHSFGAGIIRGRREVPAGQRRTVAQLFVDTVEENIVEFLAHRRHTVTMWIEAPHRPFDDLWEMIGAAGDRQAAHTVLDQRHNVRKRGRGR